jgi:large subunit ribosomal protein L17
MHGRQLSRDTEHRAALRRHLVQSLFEHGRIRTTPAKAKEVKALAERLITEARKNTLVSRRRVIAKLHDRRLVDKDQEFVTDDKGRVQTLIQKLFNDVAPKFADRHGGYTRIIKLPEYRIGDAADLVLLQLCTEESAPKGTARRSAGLRRKRNERKHTFAREALKKGSAKAEPATGQSEPGATPETTEAAPQ